MKIYSQYELAKRYSLYERRVSVPKAKTWILNMIFSIDN